MEEISLTAEEEGEILSVLFPDPEAKPRSFYRG